MDPGNQGTGFPSSLRLRGRAPWIKVCGIRTPEEASYCHLAGVDAIGLNFFSQSPRYIKKNELDAIAGAWPADLAAVGVFVSPSFPEVWKLLAEYPWIGFLQFHGLAAPVREPLPRPWILAGGAHPEKGFAPLFDMLGQCQRGGVGPCAVLLDGHSPGMHGGTGQKAPWELVKPAQWPVPVILAGGINPGNAPEAISQVGPWGIDVASGVECAPGVKDREAVFSLVHQARQRISSGP